MAATASVLQFIGGFFDGDGCVAIPEPNKGRAGPFPNPSVRFHQSFDAGVPPELEYVRERYGGIVRVVRQGWNGHRTEWELRYVGHDALPILRDLPATCVLKRPQVGAAMAYLASDRKDPMKCWKELKSAKSNYRDVAIDDERLTAAYVAGLFAAEGCVVVAKVFSYRETFHYFHADIRQNSCPRLLERIRDKIGVGKVDSGSLRCNRVAASVLFGLIQPHLVGQKKAQVDLVLGFKPRVCKRLGERRDPADKEESERIARELKRMKRL